MNEKKGVGIKCFIRAVKIVAVCQVSSEAVERVFGQLTYIRRTVGDHTLQDMMELRAYMRCNNELLDGFTITGE